MRISLKAARVSKNLTQEQAAKMLGISTNTLSNYERGKCFPKVTLIKRIEKLYEIEYKDLFFFNNNPV